MTRVPIALVGTGGMARRHLKGLHALFNTDFRNLDLVAIYGRTRDKAEALADEAEALLGQRLKVFTDLAHLADSGVIGVSITTDTGSHHTVALACLRADFHVLIEKPLALTIRGCNLVIDEARRRNRILSVAENYRRDPMNRLVRALIEDGAIGDPRVMLESRIGGENGLFITPWRHHKVSGTVIFDTGVHNADILQYYMGRARSVYGEGRLYEPLRYPPHSPTPSGTHANWTDFYAKDTGAQVAIVEATGEDALFAYIHFENGGIGQWIFHYAAFAPQEFRRVVYGSRGTLLCPGDRNGRPVYLQLGAHQTVADAAILDYAPSYRLSPLATHLFGAERPWRYDFPYADVDAKLLALELHEFGECIAEGKTPEVTGEVGRQAVALVNATLESGRLGRAVSLDEVERGTVEDYQREIDLYYGLV